MQNFIKGGSGQLKAHEDDQQGNEQTGQIFDSAMTEGVAGVRFLTGHLKADQRDQRGARIGQVVEGVRGDGDGIAEKPCEKFSQKQQDIEADSHAAAQHAVGLPHFGQVGLLIIFNP